jgi:alanine-glyoxylate transaminase/serine-glyoxylate transaminase/serine-pyruvate transaminase
MSAVIAGGAPSAGGRPGVMAGVGSFHPPQRILMGPGPSDVHPRVLEAMARPTIGHLDPAFVGMMDELKELLRYAFRTRNEVTFPVSPGSTRLTTQVSMPTEPGPDTGKVTSLRVLKA